MVESESTLKSRLLREGALLAALVFFGLAIFPLCIYLVGRAVFGEYGDGGLGGFYGQLLGAFMDGQAVVWFLLLSPCLVWQLGRLTILGFRHFKRQDNAGDSAGWREDKPLARPKKL